MEECVFCKIVAKKIPAEVVYEDSNFIAFMDINPQSPGQVQVIPKNHCKWVWDVPNIGEYFEVVQKIAKAQQKAFSTEWIISKIIGDEVPHAHVWVFPGNAKGDKKDIKGNAEKIIASLNKN